LDRSSHSWECTASKLRLKVKFIFPLRKVLKTDHSFWLQISNKLGKEILRAQLPNQTSSQNHVLICLRPSLSRDCPVCNCAAEGF
jgi:hypothetical protein